MDIIAKLKNFKEESISGRQDTLNFCFESPYERTKRQVITQLAIGESYRVSILRNVATFAHLSEEALVNTAQCMEELFFTKGNIVIEQDDVGDAFYILETGRLVVTRKQNSRDLNEQAKELSVLCPNAYFGEISLLTEEPRSATVTVTSDNCKCVRLKKQRFDELMLKTNKILAQSRTIIGQNVLDTVQVFKHLSQAHKTKLLDAMTTVSFPTNIYICRQGTPGNAFYIITEGSCRVTMNKDGKRDVELAKIEVGDFFGEVALIEKSNKRIANVISTSAVCCLVMNRADFNRLLKHMKVRLMEFTIMNRMNAIKPPEKPGGGKDDSIHNLITKRRISSFNSQGGRDEVGANTLLRRLSKFMVESLWNSLYSRMFREMSIDATRVAAYGSKASVIMSNDLDRVASVSLIRDLTLQILSLDSSKRSSADHLFICGLMHQRNNLKDVICFGWPSYEYTSVCHKLRYLRLSPLKIIFTAEERGGNAFVILRGAVRIFRKDHTKKKIYQEDLYPGEIFGQAALEGVSHRLVSAQALTEVDLASIDYVDFISAKDRSLNILSIEEKYNFLSNVPIFKHLESFKLFRLAHLISQKEFSKGSVIAKHKQESNEIFFLIRGRIDVVTSLEKPLVITSIQKYEHVGESGFLNFKTKSRQFFETFYTIANSLVDVLVFNSSVFESIDLVAYDFIKEFHLSKISWRTERAKLLKSEKSKILRHTNELIEKLPFLKSQENAATTKDNDIYSNNSSTSYSNSNSTGMHTVMSSSRKSLLSNPSSFLLDDIEDIPTLLREDFDHLMIAPTCRTPKKLNNMHDIINESRRPKSARYLDYNAKNHEELGYSASVSDGNSINAPAQLLMTTARQLLPLKSPRSLLDRDETKYVNIPPSMSLPMTMTPITPLGSLILNANDSMMSFSDHKYFPDSSISIFDNNSVFTSSTSFEPPPTLTLQGSLKLPPPKSYCDILSNRERDMFQNTLRTTRGILGKKKT